MLHKIFVCMHFEQQTLYRCVCVCVCACVRACMWVWVGGRVNFIRFLKNDSCYKNKCMAQKICLLKVVTVWNIFKFGINKYAYEVLCGSMLEHVPPKTSHMNATDGHMPSTTVDAQFGGAHVVICLQLFIQHIFSCPLYMESISSIHCHPHSLIKYKLQTVSWFLEDLLKWSFLWSR
jgi:hypothetical protein